MAAAGRLGLLQPRVLFPEEDTMTLPGAVQDDAPTVTTTQRLSATVLPSAEPPAIPCRARVIEELSRTRPASDGRPHTRKQAWGESDDMHLSPQQRRLASMLERTLVAVRSPDSEAPLYSDSGVHATHCEPVARETSPDDSTPSSQNLSGATTPAEPLYDTLPPHIANFRGEWQIREPEYQQIIGDPSRKKIAQKTGKWCAQLIQRKLAKHGYEALFSDKKIASLSRLKKKLIYRLKNVPGEISYQNEVIEACFTCLNTDRGKSLQMISVAAHITQLLKESFKVELRTQNTQDPHEDVPDGTVSSVGLRSDDVSTLQEESIYVGLEGDDEPCLKETSRAPRHVAALDSAAAADSEI